MKKTKTLITVLFSMLILLSCSAIISFGADNVTELSVTASAGEESVTVKWWKNGDSCYLFLPSDTDRENLILTYTAEDNLLLDGKVIESGDKVSLTENTAYSLTCGDGTYLLYVFSSQNLPSVHITTESGSMERVHADKSHKEPASIVIYNDGQPVIEKELEYIKGRGNASWTYIKKPYNIKFDKKTDLFGMGKAKKWSLLANYADKTAMRNSVALSLADELGIPFTSRYIHVDLYIDNEYYGNYLLCESVEVGETRVDIADLEEATEEVNPDKDLDEFTPGGTQEKNFRKLTANSQKWMEIPNDPENISGGYLLEYELPDRYVNEPCGFITARNQPIVIKAPEYASENQVKYISSLYQEFEDALYSESGYNSLGKHYTEYIDTESFVRMYLFQEFTKNLDAGITSFFIYKDTDSDKFVAAPVWDFDRALGDNFTRFGTDIGNPEGWWAGVIYHWSDNAVKGLPTVLNALYRHDDFFNMASEMWQESFSPVINEAYLTSVRDYSAQLTDSAVMNAVRWNSFSASDYLSAAESYKDFVEAKLISFISQRKTFLDKGFSDASVRVFYDSNGGNGNMFNASAVTVGEAITLPECGFTHSSMIFDSWNTKADGSGASYLPGATVTLNSGKITLYAQWKELPPEAPDTTEEPEENLSFLQRIFKSVSDFFKRIIDFIKNMF